jgi:DNA-directed RNA polymerase specialized sigma24 family protein
MLGSLSETDDAPQEALLRLSGAWARDVENLGGWLTTVVARVCLNMLRSRKARREVPLERHVPDPVVSPEAGVEPEDETLLADSVGLALLIVIDALPPAERLAFVLHDMFAVPFDEIGPMVGRSPAVVDAFFAAARGGHFDALVAVLDPDVVHRSDWGSLPGSAVVLGPRPWPPRRCGSPTPCGSSIPSW